MLNEEEREEFKRSMKKTDEETERIDRMFREGRWEEIHNEFYD
jgi:hypothetical protein